jgi:predicted ester cyclase
MIYASSDSGERRTMSATDNKAVAEDLLDAFNARDFDRARGIFADDYVNHNPPPFPGADAGRDGNLLAMRTLVEAFPDAQATTDHLLAEGDLVVVHDTVRGTHEGDLMGVSPTGKQVEVEFIHVFRIAGGRIAERWGLIDAMGLMQQIGALPAPADMAQASR